MMFICCRALRQILSRFETSKVNMKGFRFVFALLCSFASLIIYALRVNLSIAIVRMVNHTHLAEVKHIANKTNECGRHNIEPALEDGPFTWSTKIQGIILSSYYWGYLIGQLPGGYLAERFSAKWVLFSAVLAHVLGCVLIPVGAKLHFSVLLVLRLIQGLFGASVFPSLHVLQSYWVPLKNKSFISSIMYSGTSIGTVLSSLLGGFIGANLGWEAIFYIMGGGFSVWLVLWLFVAETPKEQKFFLAEEERLMILDSTRRSYIAIKEKFPLKSCLKSSAFWAIFTCNVCSNWGWYMLLIETPIYIKQVLHVNLSSNALLSSMPYLLQCVFTMILSKLLDYLRKREKISLTASRKIATLLSALIPMGALLTLAHLGCHVVVAIVLLFISVVVAGAFWIGWFCNHIDIAPKFAGFMLGITNMAGTVPAIIVPNVVGLLTGKTPIAGWRIIFYITAGLYLLECVVYGIWGTAVVQPWAEPRGEGQDGANN